MLFNSVAYIVFLAIVVVLYYGLPYRARWLFLLVASYYFYMTWSAHYALLIVASTIVDYCAALIIARFESRRMRMLGLLVSLCTNLGLLFTFKYWNFFTESSIWLFAQFGAEQPWPMLDVLLPVGISFYTFQTMAYTIDVFRRDAPPEKHLGRFALYVSFFPQLVAGPIERASHLLPELAKRHRVKAENIYLGSQLILWGLFKKVVIADRLAIYVDTVYGSVGYHNATTYLLGTYAFAYQIYCDFSGYSDIAIGSALLLGVRLMTNFRQPYYSTTIRDFWRRWHISLSTWLRDYLYIPLGGSRGGHYRTMANVMITMLLGGLWHGASWAFVVWGALQGIMLIGSQNTLEFRDRLTHRIGLPNWLRDSSRIVVTFHLVCLSWVFFRAASFADAYTILESVFTGQFGMPFVDVSVFLHAAIGLAILFVVEAIAHARKYDGAWLLTLPWYARWTIWYVLIFFILMFGVQGGSQFIYFQF